ncbi:MAG: tRNA pseudouridine(55) synthase TruB [Proteobacteria bacterium]|nr:tRNA pseudouridine(55) synthase TruB [Pseudomonadota bacterium]
MTSLKTWRGVHGILLLDKPAGISSNRALQLAKRLYGAAKAGHTGSLDPLATGLLPVCFGEATKIAGYLLGSRKAYAAQLRLGTTTTTDDAEGEVVQTRPVPPLDVALIEAALATLRGRIVQIPPAYSAIKQGGVALYKRARRGEDVIVPSREVDVHRLILESRDGDVLNLHVECGSGTYVRSLARDLGERLGCGAHLIALRRLWVEPFREPRMHTLDALERIAAQGGVAALDHLLLPLEAGVDALPALDFDADAAVHLRQGRKITITPRTPMPLCRARDPAGRLIALVEVSASGGVRILRGFNPA